MTYALFGVLRAAALVVRRIECRSGDVLLEVLPVKTPKQADFSTICMHRVQ